MRMIHNRKLLLALLIGLAGACDGPADAVDDAGPGVPDAATPAPDGAPPDAGPAADAGGDTDASGVDAGAPDAGPPPVGDVLASAGYFDVVLDTDRHQVFFSYRDARTVEVVDLNTGPVTTLNTTWYAEHMSYHRDTDVVAISLPVQDHSPFWFDDDQEGYVASIDAVSPADPIPLYIPRDPWQIVTDGEGYAYVSGGSGQHTNAVAIDLGTAAWSLTGIHHKSNIQIHPNEDRIYSVTDGLSSNSLERREISSGTMTFTAESPDDNDYDVCGDLRIAPSGSSIFTRCGHVFTAADAASEDMRWRGTIETTWDDLTFDPTGSFAYVLVDGLDTLDVVDTQTLAPVTTLSIGAGVRRILTGTNYLVLIRDVMEMGVPRARAEILPYSALRVRVATQCSSTVTMEPPTTVCTDDCAELYPTGTMVTLTASGAAAESFDGWTGPCSGTGTCAVTMDRSREVGASFSGPTEPLSVALAGSGTGTVTSDRPGIVCDPVCAADFVRDCPIALSAVPSPSSEFTGWSGDCSGTGACSLSMDSPSSVTADFNSLGDVIWAVQLGGTDYEDLTEIVVDGSGNVFAVGGFGGNPDWGGGPLPNAGQLDFFVAKHLSDGTFDWAVSNGTSQHDKAWDAAVDASGNVFVAGYYEGTVTFAGVDHTSTMWADAFVAKYAADGTELWFRSFGGPKHDDMELQLDVMSSGDVVVAGGFEESMDFGAGSVVANDTSDADMFVARYDGADGSLVWVIHHGPIRGAPGVIPVAVDTDDNVIVAGTFRNTVDFGGPSSLTSFWNDDLFVAKYSGATGAHVWSKRAGGFGSPSVKRVTLDAADDVVVTGSFDGEVDFGGGTITAAAPTSFVAHYEGVLGAYIDVFAHGAGTSFGVDLNAAGEMLLVGGMRDTVDFGGGPLTSAGESDIYVVKYEGGVYRWSRIYGGINIDNGRSGKFDPAGNLVVGATFRSTFDIDTTTYDATNTDILILKLEP